tara:strand:+ start:618 stop:794 length:177 start_codon:yes stop_codon:yes gene_type:complete
VIPNLDAYIHGNHDVMPSIEEEQKDQIKRDIEDERLAEYQREKEDYDELPDEEREEEL